MTTASLPRFDEIDQHPDHSVTAYTYFSHDETTMRALSQELFGNHWQPASLRESSSQTGVTK